MQANFGTFNQAGMRDLREIAIDWNCGNLSAERAMAAIADLLSDTFGSQVMYRLCAVCEREIDSARDEWTQFGDGRYTCSAGCYEAARS